jgi:hypothetical protein
MCFDLPKLLDGLGCGNTTSPDKLYKMNNYNVVVDAYKMNNDNLVVDAMAGCSQLSTDTIGVQASMWT